MAVPVAINWPYQESVGRICVAAGKVGAEVTRGVEGVEGVVLGRVAGLANTSLECGDLTMGDKETWMVREVIEG